MGAATFSALGLIVASVTNNTQETQVINNVIWFTFLFFSGATFPLVILPLWIQHGALFLPATYLVSGLQGSMLNTAKLPELTGDVVALTVGLLVAFDMSRRLFRWEPEQKVPGKSKLWVVVALVPFILLGLWENAYGSRLQQIHQQFNTVEHSRPPDAPH
jgi:hypothetical protein